MQFGITLQWANINFVDFFHALFEDFQKCHQYYGWQRYVINNAFWIICIFSFENIKIVVNFSMIGQIK